MKRSVNLLRPRTGTDLRFDLTPYYPSFDGRCDICSDYDGLHLRCWWAWLTEERVIRGYNDGEQQVEPDEPYPSRWRVVRSTISWWLSPRYWYYRARGWL